VNQAIRTLSRFEPAETPAPISSPVDLIAKPVNGHLIEAVPCSVSDEDTPAAQAYYKGRWLVVERDAARSLIRGSTATYASAKLAFDAYWYASADDPLDWETWVSPIFATSLPKIVTSHIFPPIPDRSMDWCAYYDGEEERGNYGYGTTEQAAIEDLTANYERA
jgi:hypothetical protein